MDILRPSCCLSLIALLLAAAPVRAQLPEGWDALSTSEFLELGKAALEPEAGNPHEVVEAIRTEAARRLAAPSVLAGEAYNDLLKLRSLAGGALEEEQKTAIKEALRNRTDDLSALPFEELKDRMRLSWRFGMPDPVDISLLNAEAISQWVAGRSSLDEVSERDLAWCLNQLDYPKSCSRSFHVTWTGQISAPRSGEYVFSVSPFDVNYEQPSEYVKQSMSVEVGGRGVVNATPDSWDYAGEPITLTAGQPVAIRVEYDYEVAVWVTTTPRFRIQADRSPCATLSWSGPGISRSVVPESAFREGLAADYEFRFRDLLDTQKIKQRVFHSRPEGKIDHAWVGGENLASPHTDQRDRLAAAIWNRTMTPEYWAACVNWIKNPPIEAELEAMSEEEADRQHWLLRTAKSRTFSAYLTASQRRQFLDQLASHKEVLNDASFGAVYDIYTRYWFGAEDEALAVLVAWMAAHPDEEPRLAGRLSGFHKKNRADYRKLTIPTMLEYPEHIEELEALCLELEDGRCCLPVAYTCAYAHLQQGKIKEWIAELDARLADESLTGDKRVNWLIARAMAEEIRQLPPTPFYKGAERVGAGERWLEEASLVATSDNARSRSLLELFARRVALADYDDAESLLKSMPGKTTPLTEKIASLREGATRRVAQQEAASKRALVAEYERRRDLAAGRGDEKLRQRYEALVEQATAAE